jgi:hypothetical protein
VTGIDPLRGVAHRSDVTVERGSCAAAREQPVVDDERILPTSLRAERHFQITLIPP